MLCTIHVLQCVGELRPQGTKSEFCRDPTIHLHTTALPPGVGVGNQITSRQCVDCRQGSVQCYKFKMKQMSYC